MSLVRVERELGLLSFELTCQSLESDLLWACGSFGVLPVGHRQFVVTHDVLRLTCEATS